MEIDEIENYKKAGQVAQKIRKFVRGYVKPGMSLVEIAKTIQEEIEKLGAIAAFPPTLSIDEMAAHYHPSPGEDTKASGIIKVDFGVSVDGYIADTALSLDLTEDNRHKELVEASEKALANVLKLLESDPTIHEIGQMVQKTIQNLEFSPIVNLSGHSLGQYSVHAGVTIPNYGNNNEKKLEPGAYAIEPFATTGEGKVQGGPPGNIYEIVDDKTPRSPKAREILKYVKDKYKSLPFSLTEIQDNFGRMSKLALNELEQQGIIKSHNGLVERSKGFVSQAEHTVIITDDRGVIVTTRED